jgi:hypothetical protein
MSDTPPQEGRRKKATARKEDCETCKWRESEIGYPSPCPLHANQPTTMNNELPSANYGTTSQEHEPKETWQERFDELIPEIVYLTQKTQQFHVLKSFITSLLDEAKNEGHRNGQIYLMEQWGVRCDKCAGIGGIVRPDKVHTCSTK